MIDRLERVAGRPVSRETCEQIEAYAALLVAANSKQNLIATSTVDQVWERHIFDSAQLAGFEPAPGVSWLDVGSGPGLPGIVVALLVEGPVTLAEPRRLRAEFLRETVSTLGLSDRVRVAQAQAEQLAGVFDVITGRAVARLDQFLGIAHHLSHRETVWLLPKGRGAKSELAEAQRNWHCEARAERSCTDPDAAILVLRRVGAKRTR
jgi:16S rRNA (guanine527-N7)-methyltransferase